jgi:hypothetical protein
LYLHLGKYLESLCPGSAAILKAGGELPAYRGILNAHPDTTGV